MSDKVKGCYQFKITKSGGSYTAKPTGEMPEMDDVSAASMLELEKALHDACVAKSGYDQINFKCDTLTKTTALWTAAIHTQLGA